MVKEFLDPEAAAPEARVRALEHTLDSVRSDSEVAHVLLGLSAALGEVRTVEETLEKAVRLVPELCGGQRCFAAVWDQAIQRFEICARFGYDEQGSAVLDELTAAPDGLPFMKAATFSHRPLLIDDVLLDERMSKDEAERRGLRGYIVMPLVRWGDDFGAMAIEFSHPKQFTPKDAALVRGIARQVGVALANARRFNLLQRLRGFGLSIATRLRLADVVAHTAAGAAQLLGGESAMLYFFDSQRDAYVSSAAHAVSGRFAEAMSTIDATSPPWNKLLEGETIFVEGLKHLTDEPTSPLCAIGTTLPGVESPRLGAVVVFFRGSTTVGPDEAEALNVLAAQAGIAIENAQRFERQSRVARALQSGLMSTEMPKMTTCEIGAIYQAAGSEAEVGGDFFDVFELSDGRVAMVVGDVSGKGAEAAAQTAMAKYMLRAFAMRNPAPSSVLFHLNNALVQGLPEDRFTTAVYAVLEPDSRYVQQALGGHPPALVYRGEDGRVDSVELEGPIIGAFEDQQFESAGAYLQRGDVWIAYTDGLAETRSNGELYGRDRITESLKRHADADSAEDVARRIYDDAVAFGLVADDTVVFALRCIAD